MPDMYRDSDFPAVYRDGVLRPGRPLDLPDNTRVRVAIRRIDVSADEERRGRLAMAELRRKGVLRLNGWPPSRDELHERR